MLRAVERLELIRQTVQNAVDNGATNIEQVHQYIAALPFETLEKMGFFEERAGRMRERQAEGIGIAYDRVRNVNRQVGVFFSEIFGQLEDAQLKATKMIKRGKPVPRS